MLIRSFPEPDVPADLLAQVRDLRRMARPGPSFPSPEGRAHRLSFHHARTELHPGEIDRLR
ncbi:hypothetical protein [Nonomuraea roseoviolacea]|uniref:Uncharacterized protein n=1 Tax=Nonomuraea roseoviolacea subsp. carminata TaxID=160689 RepID=A0ABT1K553_9ACTN|nr:hypothetical protein [Nonomuraea roseoviolacea]MCP2349140.1 hypothetical protein [Nonomuraea roseoviolacea subsp. carminata]